VLGLLLVCWRMFLLLNNVLALFAFTSHLATRQAISKTILLLEIIAHKLIALE